MNTFALLILLGLVFVVLLPIAMRPFLAQVLFRRRSIDGITDFLQEVQHHAADLELALSTQDQLKENCDPDVIGSETGYRLAVMENIDRLREYFWRMRRNAITAKEFAFTALSDEIEIARQEAKEAEERLKELADAVKHELQEPLQPYPLIIEMLQ